MSITAAWSDLLQGVIPARPVDPTLAVPKTPVKKGIGDDFLNHVYFDERTEYLRENIYFTGNPTITNVINAPLTGVFNPTGIPDPSVFQPSGNQIYSFMDFGTRGWLSDRVNTHFALRYRQDLTHVDRGSPELDVLNTYNANRLFELLTANVEITSKPGDGWFAGSSIQLGRVDVYGAELAQLDGAAFTMNRRKYSFTLFGGRRFSYFSDPEQRAVGGGNFLYRFADDSSLEYEALFYIKGSHHVLYRRRMGPRWMLTSGYKMIGSYPIDFNLDAIWNAANGKTNLRVGFAEKLSNKDYFFDYTINARDLDPNNPLLRLYLGPLSVYSQFIIDGHRTLAPRVSVGGSVWVRRLLNNASDQGPFDTSFQDYRASAQVLPARDTTLFFGYHERDSDRLSPFPSTNFFDISKTGSTKIQDFTAEVGRNFGETGRLSLRAGGFYRRMNFQDQFYVLEHLHDRGVLGELNFKVDPRTRLYFNYDLDTDFFLFAPNVKDAQSMRVGLAWRY
jgi:hypothetical protein